VPGFVRLKCFVKKRNTHESKPVAIGLLQRHATDSSIGLIMENGRIAVNEARKTSLDNVWAGGDCVFGGEDLTVGAVQDGKLAAQSIHEYLQSS